MRKTLPTISTIGSHSALDVCHGAKKLHFKTLVIAQKGREVVYASHYKTNKNIGCVDETLILDQFKDILTPAIQHELKVRNSIFIPNRSFEVYVKDYDAIENDFDIPMFGNKYLLRTEERTGALTQYDILQTANIRTPQKIKTPQEIDRLCIVKANQKERPHERAFFFAQSFKEYTEIWDEQVGKGMIDPTCIPFIEEYIVGVQVNLNFFYSPIHQRLELLGTDTRRQTNFSGLISMPARDQLRLPDDFHVSFEEAGHTAVTILESMLEDAYRLGDQFVKATQKLKSPGVIGPFSLQASIVTDGRKKEFVVFDVSPRMPGSPGVRSTPYSGYLFGESISVGERVAMEIRDAVEQGSLSLITT